MTGVVIDQLRRGGVLKHGARNKRFFLVVDSKELPVASLKPSAS